MDIKIFMYTLNVRFLWYRELLERRKEVFKIDSRVIGLHALLTFMMFLLIFIFFLAFTKCAHQRTFSLAWACRKEHKAMKDCMEKL